MTDKIIQISAASTTHPNHNHIVTALTEDGKVLINYGDGCWENITPAFFFSKSPQQMRVEMQTLRDNHEDDDENDEDDNEMCEICGQVIGVGVLCCECKMNQKMQD